MPRPTRRTYLRRRVAVFGGLGAALAAAFYLPLTLLAPLGELEPAVLPYQAPVTAVAVPSLPSFGASAIGAVGFPGVLASAGTDAALPIASIAKIITALVVLDAKPLSAGEAGPSITMTTADEEFYAGQLAQNGSVKPVYAGLVMSQYELLEVVLLPSANNYAQSLAAWAFGSESAYLGAAKEWLAAHGLAHTTITDPTGIQPTNVSSTADLLEIAKLAIANPVIAAITAQKAAEIPGVGTVHNTNHLLGIDGVDGIKTGTLDEAGACLLFSADYTVGEHTVTLVGVSLGGPDHDVVDANVRSLLATTLSGIHEVEVAAAGEQFAAFDSEWGDEAAAVAVRSKSLLTWSDTPVTVLVHVDPIAGGAKGTDVGFATFTAGEQSVSVDLELDATIDDPGAWWRITNPALLF